MLSSELPQEENNTKKAIIKIHNTLRFIVFKFYLFNNTRFRNDMNKETLIGTITFDIWFYAQTTGLTTAGNNQFTFILIE